jgi:hypothetical protein
MLTRLFREKGSQRGRERATDRERREIKGQREREKEVQMFKRNYANYEEDSKIWLKPVGARNICLLKLEVRAEKYYQS